MSIEELASLSGHQICYMSQGAEGFFEAIGGKLPIICPKK